HVTSFWGLLANPWALIQYAHNMSGSVITGAFVMAALGAFYLLEGKFVEHARVFLRVGVIAGVIFSIVQIFPTGDLQGKFMARHPEGKFQRPPYARNPRGDGRPVQVRNRRAHGYYWSPRYQTPTH